MVNRKYLCCQVGRIASTVRLRVRIQNDLEKVGNRLEISVMKFS